MHIFQKTQNQSTLNVPSSEILVSFENSKYRGQKFINHS